MSFSDIAGHEGALKVLRRAILTNRVPQAYLFVGPANVGKTFVAMEVAKALNCEQIVDPQSPEDVNPCGVCRECVAIERGNHPDMLVINPAMKLSSTADDDASNEDQFVDIEGALIRIEQIRDQLIPHTWLKRSRARRKVYIIVRADTMNASSENALLKTLEEPPPNTTVILTATNSANLLNTTVSRCQVINFYPVPSEVSRAYLASSYPHVDAAQIASIVAMSSGRLGWAISLLQRPEVLGIREDLLDLCAELSSAEWVECLRAGERLVDAAERWWLATNDEEMAERALKSSRDRVLRTSMHDILDILATWFRDMLLLSSSPGAEGLINADRAEQLRALAVTHDPKKCARACQHLQEMQGQLKQNANLRMAAEALALRLIVT